MTSKTVAHFPKKVHVKPGKIEDFGDISKINLKSLGIYGSPSSTVILHDVHPSCCENDIKIYFGKVGKIKKIVIGEENSKKYAIVEYETINEAIGAMSQFISKNFFGKPITMTMVQGKKPTTLVVPASKAQTTVFEAKPITTDPTSTNVSTTIKKEQAQGNEAHGGKPYCKDCDMSFSHIQHYQRHLQGMMHTQRMASESKNDVKPEMKPIEKLIDKLKEKPPIGESTKTTSVVNTSCSTSTKTTSVVNTSENKESTSTEDSTDAEDWQRCADCNLTFTHQTKYYQHLRGMMHMQNIISKRETSGGFNEKTMIDESAKLTSSKSSQQINENGGRSKVQREFGPLYTGISQNSGVSKANLNLPNKGVNITETSNNVYGTQPRNVTSGHPSSSINSASGKSTNKMPSHPFSSLNSWTREVDSLQQAIDTYTVNNLQRYFPSSSSNIQTQSHSALRSSITNYPPRAVINTNNPNLGSLSNATQLSSERPSPNVTQGSTTQHQTFVDNNDTDDNEDWRRCDLCKKDFTIMEDYHRHLRGMLHAQKVINKCQLQGILPEEENKDKNWRERVDKLEENRYRVDKDKIEKRLLSIADVITPEPPQTVYCGLCNISCSSESCMADHLLGTRHLKMLKLAEKGELEWMKVDKKEEEGVRELKGKTPYLQEFLDTTTEPLVGVNFIVEYWPADPIPANKEPHYYCNLCLAKCTFHSMRQHLIGTKHRSAYLKLRHPDMFHQAKYASDKKAQLTSNLAYYCKQIISNMPSESPKVFLDPSRLKSNVDAVLVKTEQALKRVPHNVDKSANRRDLEIEGPSASKKVMHEWNNPAFIPPSLERPYQQPPPQRPITQYPPASLVRYPFSPESGHYPNMYGDPMHYGNTSFSQVSRLSDLERRWEKFHHDRELIRELRLKSSHLEREQIEKLREVDNMMKKREMLLKKQDLQKDRNPDAPRRAKVEEIDYGHTRRATLIHGDSSASSGED